MLRPAVPPGIKHMYLPDMPADERERLCQVLDENSLWMKLAHEMGYSSTITNEVQQELHHSSSHHPSPSDCLLVLWTQYNHTVTELFVLLARLKAVSALEIIKNLVDAKYHRLIQIATPLPSEIVSNEDNQSIVSEQKKPAQSVASSNNPQMEEFSGILPHIDYDELTEATNNWDSKELLGRGGFGDVYKGCWKHTLVAIKQIVYRKASGPGICDIELQQSLNEFKHLSSCRHDNVLPLYGYSINGKKRCLVYQLMPGGSLEARLSAKSSKPPLTFPERSMIAQGTARGIQFLHTFRDIPLVHGDIKPANILLDIHNIPKIGDFGLAREGPKNVGSMMDVSKVFGTKPYLPFEFLRSNKFSTKVDTYSFGVVLYELATGQRAFDKDREDGPFLTDYILRMIQNKITIDVIADEALRPFSDQARHICKTMIEVGVHCTAYLAKDRPDMRQVLSDLQR